MQNMEIYEKVRSVPKDAQKEIVGGRLKGMTDINPMWRIKMLTEMFGPCGFGWKTEIVNKWLEKGGGEDVACFVEINLYIKVNDQWSEPIPGVGGSSFVTKERNGLYTSDECYKMAYTDAISVACKSLGFAADIYYKNDRTKYNTGSSEPKDEQKTDIPPASLKAKYQTGKGSMDGFDDWVKEMQSKGLNFKQMEEVLAKALLKKKEKEEKKHA